VCVCYRKCARDALEDVCEWLDGGGEVAVSIVSSLNWVLMSQNTFRLPWYCT